jgi:PAS domain S-box-containing protein
MTDIGSTRRSAPRSAADPGHADALVAVLREAMDEVNESICLTDARGGIVVANRAFHRINASVAEHLRPGCAYEDHIRAGMALGHYPDAVGREEDWIAKRMAQRRAGGGPYRVRRQDGRVLEVNDRRLADGSVITFANEATDQWRIDEADRRFRAAMDASADMILLIDRAAMRYVDVNENVCRTLGYAREEMLRMGPQDVLPFAREHLEREYDAFIANPSSISGMRSEYRCKDGSRIPFESTRRLLRLAEGTLIVAISRDIRGQLATEQALRDLNQSLERRVAERTEALETAVRELEAFSYSVSHDLRAPLRALDGHAHMLVETEAASLSGEGRRHLQAIQLNARRMGQLVDDLLGLARVNRMALHRRPLDLGVIAASVVAELWPRYMRAQAVVGTLPMVEGDAGLVRQVLTNLVDNAFKYSAKSDAPRVEVDWDEQAHAVRVSDNGVGFDMQHAAKLFGTFERLHTLREFEGTGIGLAIVKRIVERHGGRAWADSAPGRGARFYFTLGPA